MDTLSEHPPIPVSAWWKHPVAWVSVWLFYSFAVLGYLSYDSAQRGIFC